MGKLIVSTNITLDGGVQDPAGDERPRVGGGWFNRISEDDRAAWAEVETAEAMNAEALLLGRRSYAWFAPRWSVRTGNWADRLNNMPKYVVSSTLSHPDWTNTTVIAGDAQQEVELLKKHTSGDVVVYGSGLLVKALVEWDLVDEFRLMIFPCILGSGTRLFGATTEVKHLQLVESRVVGASLTYAVYRVPAGAE